MLKEERHTAHAISFEVDLGNQAKQHKVPKIKKRLEEEAAAEPPQITLDKIKEKLEKAEEKRKKNLNTAQQMEDRLEAFKQRRTSQQ